MMIKTPNDISITFLNMCMIEQGKLKTLES